MEYPPSKKFLRRRYEKRKRGYFKTFMGKNSTFERFLGSTIYLLLRSHFSSILFKIGNGCFMKEPPRKKKFSTQIANGLERLLRMAAFFSSSVFKLHMTIAICCAKKKRIHSSSIRDSISCKCSGIRMQKITATTIHYVKSY